MTVVDQERLDRRVDEKRAALKASLREMASVLIAYSGGVDSTFLAATANEVLDSRAMAVTASSPSLARSELEGAVAVAGRLGINHRVVETQEVERADYARNDPNRCFFCKDELYTQLTALAEAEGYAFVANGANVDDLDDMRPGLNAAAKYGVRTPLVEAGLTKDEIRSLSRSMGLPTWDKPAQACLSSRVPYGTPVSVEVLSRIGEAEEYLRSLGIGQLRVRDHGKTARIEVVPSEMGLLVKDRVREAVAAKFKELGYSYVSLDLEGFRSGSLNEVLPGRRRKRQARQAVDRP